MSLDGRTAAADGTSQWITGAEARADAHRLRAESQAVVVGAGHRARRPPDASPCATSTPPVERQPLRVLLDARGPRARRRAAVRRRRSRRRSCVTTDAAPDDAADAWRAAGAKVETSPPARDGRGVDLAAALDAARAAHGVLQALVEGGAHAARRVRRRRARRPARRLRRRRCCSATDGRAGVRRRPGPARSPTRRGWRLVDVARARRRRPARLRPPSEPTGEAGLMFTGIVEELGTVRAVTPADGGARIEIARATRARRRRDRRLDRGQRLLPDRRRARRRLVGGRRGHRDARPHRARRARAPATAVNLERPVRLADRLGGHIVQGHVDGVGAVVGARPAAPTARPACGSPRRGELAALRRREGLDHRRRHQPHRRRASTTTTASSVAVIPHTLAVTTLGVARRRATRSTSRSTCSPSTSSGLPRTRARAPAES